ncbi:hypothetical protein [Agrococcus sp. ARC_14]|uniref:hypothetical protein n=1 Tax=Agrococcus sp. ARC_14 TaxID=2919927 RepID=UPI001F0582FD|nr:hypothetical protein [Agrococcus sp. ARC_14]MCH1881844.1 hypothetical protein [Agrococcus sp. ARC_14]
MAATQTQTATVEHEHEHGWGLESAHATSQGRLLYTRCMACGARRVELEPVPTMPPAPLSVVV